MNTKIRRNSIQRQLVMDALKSLDHPSAMEVFAEIQKTYPQMSLGTAYRHFQVMEEDGLIRRLSIPNSADRFDINPEPHQHIRCIRCGLFHDVEEINLGYIDRNVEKSTEFSVLSHHMIFNGLCPKCRDKNDIL